MAYLAAISTATTIPLFIRTRGNVPPVAFPIIGSLNTVHLFASNLEASLLSCSTSGVQVVWKTFHNSITLILVVSKDVATHLDTYYLLEMVFGAMVLLVGLQELEDVNSKVERLKNELKCCYPLIDCILQGTEDGLLSVLTKCADILVVDNVAIIEKTLEGYVEAAQSSFGCMMVHRRLCVATESWWGLSSLELSLIAMLLTSLPQSSCRDIPIYLPRASSKVPHRLVVFTLLEGVELCVLCDSEPPLPELQGAIEAYWSSVEHHLKNYCHSFLRCVPFSFKIDPAILAFCITSVDKRKSLTCLSPSSPNRTRTALTAGFQGEMSVHKRHTYLTRFYKTATNDLSTLQGSDQETSEEQQVECLPVAPHKVTEIYSCAKHYKAYAIHQHNLNLNLFTIFDTRTPTFALRRITQELLQHLVDDICDKIL